MAVCAICGKKPISGNKISIARSHVSRRFPRTWRPNLRSVKAEIDGETKIISMREARTLKKSNEKAA